MRCASCGAELSSEEQECTNCRTKDTEIKVLTPEEQRDFAGITIDQAGQNTSEKSDQYQNPRERIYVRHTTFSLPQTGFFVKLLIGAGLIILSMAALSTVFFFVVIGCIIWFVLRLFR